MIQGDKFFFAEQSARHTSFTLNGAHPKEVWHACLAEILKLRPVGLSLKPRMEDLVTLVVYSGKEFLLVETVSKNLRLPSCSLYKNEDFVTAATRLLDKVPIIISWLAGILSTQMHPCLN